MATKHILAGATASVAILAADGVYAAEFRSDVRLNAIEIRASSTTDPAPGSRASVYPSAARKAGTDGVVVLGCQIQAQARFGDCKVLEEDPADAGFADVAMAIAPRIQQAVPKGKGGVATEGPAIVPFRFVIEENERRVVSDKVVWERKPTKMEGEKAYPLVAGDIGYQGVVTLECKLTAEGSLTACRSLFETPYGYKFKEAALSLVPKFKARTTLIDGSPLPSGATVRVPMIFMQPRASHGPPKAPQL